MRRLTTAAAAALLLALTGCGSEPDSNKPAASATPSPSVDREAEFLADVKAASFASWKTAAPPDAELVTYPMRWCNEFEAGHSVAYIIGDESLYPIGQTWGTAKADAQELIVLAVTSYCPQYRDQVTEELRGSGQY